MKDGTALIEGVDYTVTIGTNNATFNGLDEGTYTFEITTQAWAYKGGENNMALMTVSTDVEVTTGAPKMTGEIAVTATPSTTVGGRVALSWTPVTAGTETVAYTVVVKKGDTTLVAGAGYSLDYTGGTTATVNLLTLGNYTFEVVAVAPGYASKNGVSAEVEVTVKPAFTKLENVFVQGVTQSAISIRWDAVGVTVGNQQFEVQLSIGDDASWGNTLIYGTGDPRIQTGGSAPTGSRSTTHANIIQLEANTEYYIRIKVAGTADYDASEEWVVLGPIKTLAGATASAAGNIQSFVATSVTSDSITLVWAKADRYDNPIIGYEIQYGVAGTGWLTWYVSPGNPVIEETTVTLTGLVPGAIYDIQVRSVGYYGRGNDHSDKRSGWSNLLSINTTPQVTRPTATCVSKDKQSDSTWTVGIEWKADERATEYVIEWMQWSPNNAAPKPADWETYMTANPTNTKTVSAPASSAEVEGLLDGESYWFRVRAIGVADEIRDSDWAYIGIPVEMKAKVVATSVNNFKALGVANSSVRLVWDAVPGVIDPSYELGQDFTDHIYRNVKDGADGEFLSGPTTFEEYFEILYSLDGTNWRTVQVGGNGQRIQNGGGWLTSVAVNIADLGANTKYYFKMRVLETVNNAGSDWSDVIEITTLAAAATRPAAVTNLQADVAAADAVTVSWTASTATNVVAYEVRYRTVAVGATPAGIWKMAMFFGTGTSATITGLTLGTEYEFQVRTQAATGAGNNTSSDWTSSVRATPTTWETSVKVDKSKFLTDDEVMVSWSPFPIQEGAVVVEYRIEWREVGGADWTTDLVGSTTALDTDTSFALDVTDAAFNLDGGEYEFRVVAIVDETGCIPPGSATEEYATDVAADTVTIVSTIMRDFKVASTNLGINGDAVEAQLRWQLKDPPTGTLSYKYYYKVATDIDYTEVTQSNTGALFGQVYYTATTGANLGVNIFGLIPDTEYDFKVELYVDTVFEENAVMNETLPALKTLTGSLNVQFEVNPTTLGSDVLSGTLTWDNLIKDDGVTEYQGYRVVWYRVSQNDDGTYPDPPSIVNELYGGGAPNNTGWTSPGRPDSALTNGSGYADPNNWGYNVNLDEVNRWWKRIDNKNVTNSSGANNGQQPWYTGYSTNNPTGTGSDNNNGQGYSMSGETLAGLSFTTQDGKATDVYYIMVVTYDAARADEVNNGGGRPTIGGGYANVNEIIMIGKDGVISRDSLEFAVKLGGTEQVVGQGYSETDVKAINWGGLTYWDAANDAAVEPTVIVKKGGVAHSNAGFDVTVFSNHGSGFVTIPTGLAVGEYTVNLEWELTDGTKYYAESTFSVLNALAGTLAVSAVQNGDDVTVTATGITTPDVEYTLTVRNGAGAVVTGYTITSGEGTATQTITGLGGGRVYTFEMTADAGESYKSQSKVADEKVGVAIQNFKTERATTTDVLFLQWDAVSGISVTQGNAGSFNAAFRVEFSLSGDPGTWTLLGVGNSNSPRIPTADGNLALTGTSCRIIEATAGLTYHIRIISVELYNAGFTDKYNTLAPITTTSPTQAPNGAPGGLVLANVPGTTTVTFGWNKMIGARGAHYFEVEYRKVGDTEWGETQIVTPTEANVMTLSFTSPALEGDTEYEFQVRAWNPVDYGTWTNPVAIKTLSLE